MESSNGINHSLQDAQAHLMAEAEQQPQVAAAYAAFTRFTPYVPAPNVVGVTQMRYANGGNS